MTLFIFTNAYFAVRRTNSPNLYFTLGIDNSWISWHWQQRQVQEDQKGPPAFQDLSCLCDTPEMSNRHLVKHFRAIWCLPRSLQSHLSNLKPSFSFSNAREIVTQAQDLGIHSAESGSKDCSNSTEPPDLPIHCCMSGCANCVWLDYAEEMVKFYERKGAILKLEQLLQDIDDNLTDEMIKAFVKMEIKFAYGKKLKSWHPSLFMFYCRLFFSSWHQRFVNVVMVTMWGPNERANLCSQNFSNQLCQKTSRKRFRFGLTETNCVIC